MTPVGDKVLIQPDYTSEVNTGSKIIEVTTKVPKTGTILAVAEGYDYKSDCGVELNVGDKVRYEHNRQYELPDKTILLPAHHIVFKINN